MSDLPENVVRLPVVTPLNLDADTVLREAVGTFKEVIILGYDHDGEEHCMTSISGGSEMLWLLARYQKKLLEIPETWDGETHKRPGA